MRRADVEALAEATALLVVEHLERAEWFRRALHLSAAGDERRYSPKEIATLCRCSEKTVRRAIHAGRLEATAAPGVGDAQPRLLVRESDMAKFRERTPM